MKILNLFCGIGGNRTLWDEDHDITAVEWDQRIAMIYHKRFPKDKVIIGDAYEYFINNFEKFDFVWASPPCPSHSRINHILVGTRYNNKKCTLQLPDLRLYSLIFFLKSYFRSYWVVENVITYYKPLITPNCIIGRHYIWCNYYIKSINSPIENILNRKKGKKNHISFEKLCEYHMIDYKIFENIKRLDKKKIIKNCVKPIEGKYILDCVENKKQKSISDYYG